MKKTNTQTNLILVLVNSAAFCLSSCSGKEPQPKFEELVNNSENIPAPLKDEFLNLLSEEIILKGDGDVEINDILDIISTKSDTFGTIQIHPQINEEDRSISLKAGTYSVADLLSQACSKLDARLAFDERGRIYIVGKVKPLKK